MRCGVLSWLSLVLQDPHDRNYCVPIPCRRRNAVKLIDFTKIGDRLHVATVYSKHELPFRFDHAHQPFPFRGILDRKRRPNATGFGQDAYESNNIRAGWLGSKRIFRLQADKIATVAEDNFRFEWQLPEQFSAKPCSRSGFPNHKRPCGTYIHDTVVSQFSCEDTWAKGPVPANIDSTEKNNQSHSGIIEEKAGAYAIS